MRGCELNTTAQKTISNGWDYRPLRELIESLESGVSVNGADYPANADQFGVLKISAVTSGVFRPDENKALKPGELKRARCVPQLGKILISRANTIELVGASAIVNVYTPNLFLPDKLWQVNTRKDQPVNTIWLRSLLSSPRLRARISARATGTGAGMKNISQSAFLGIVVPVPTRSEQNRIAKILETWDRAIQSAELLLALKERRKRALMQQLLIGRRRFPKFVKSRKVRNTRFGERPVDWAYVEIGNIASEISERAGSHEASPVFSCTKSAGLVPSLEYFGKRVFSEDTSAYKRVRKCQFAYATNHLEEGSIGLMEHADVGLVSPLYTVFQTSPAVNTTFLYALFKTELYRHIFEVYTSSSVDRRGSLRWNEFKKIHVALPPLEEQCRIASLIETCDREIRQLTNEIACLKRQKRGLMSKLLTGQVRIPHSRERM